MKNPWVIFGLLYRPLLPCCCSCWRSFTKQRRLSGNPYSAGWQQRSRHADVLSQCRLVISTVACCNARPLLMLSRNNIYWNLPESCFCASWNPTVKHYSFLIR